MKTIHNLTLSKNLNDIVCYIETCSGKTIDVRYNDNLQEDEGQSFWENDEQPYVSVSNKGTTVEVIAHELLHLELRVKGYPHRFEPWTGIDRSLDNLLQHYVIYSQYISIGLNKDKFINLKAKCLIQQKMKDLLENKFSCDKEQYNVQSKEYECYALCALSDFYRFNQAEKDLIKKKISWQTANYWVKWSQIVQRASKDGKNYVKAFRQARYLLGIPMNDLEAIYVLVKKRQNNPG